VGSPLRFEDTVTGTPVVGRQSRSNQSPPIVSAKREYLRIWPETFGNFHLRTGKLGVQRRNRMREEPGFPARSPLSWGARPNARMAGWGGRDRTSEWRNQNPLPYRLATPQQAGAGNDTRFPRPTARLSRECVHFNGGAQPNFGGRPRRNRITLPLFPEFVAGPLSDGGKRNPVAYLRPVAKAFKGLPFAQPKVHFNPNFGRDS
jgi:hypothetical protein